jgi:hypothetical protein
MGVIANSGLYFYLIFNRATQAWTEICNNVHCIPAEEK